MVTGLPRRSTVRITAGSHVVCSTFRQLPVLSMCSLSQTRREKSIPDAAFSMGARHKNSIRSQLFFADMCKRHASSRGLYTCSACTYREEKCAAAERHQWGTSCLSASKKLTFGAFHVILCAHSLKKCTKIQKICYFAARRSCLPAKMCYNWPKSTTHNVFLH